MDEDEAYELYDEWLDDLDGPIKAGGCVFDASRVLKELDPSPTGSGSTTGWTLRESR